MGVTQSYTSLDEAVSCVGLLLHHILAGLRHIREYRSGIGSIFLFFVYNRVAARLFVCPIFSFCFSSVLIRPWLLNVVEEAHEIIWRRLEL